MAKTKETKLLEQAIIKETSKKGVFNCLEVTIGFGGKRRVDFMSMDTKNVFRCYEIKISKSDFHSKHGHNFVGHYNYYVMPKELYEEVKDEIPKEIGVYTGNFWSNKNKDYYSVELIKRPKKKEVTIDIETLKNSLLRSLYRDVEKGRKSNNVELVTKLKSKISNLNDQYYKERNSKVKLSNYLYEKLGREEFRKLKDELGI